MKIKYNREDLEQWIVATSIVNPKLIEEVLINWNSEVFQDESLKAIWQLSKDLIKSGEYLTFGKLTASEFFQNFNTLEREFIIECCKSITLIENSIQAYIQAMKDYIVEDKIRGITKQALEMKNPEGMKSHLLDNIIPLNCSNDSLEIDNIYDTCLSDFIYKRENNVIPCIETGYRALDKGFILQKTNLVILAAQPSMGKSTLALNIAENIAKKGKSVLFISLEMSESELIMKLVSRCSGISLYKIQASNNLTFEEFELAQRTYHQLKQLPIHYKKKAEKYNYSEIARQIREFKENNPTAELIIIDYLLLIDVSESKQQNRSYQIGELTRQFKQLAMELDICILMLSQLNRTVNETKSKLPELYHLKDSSSIEQDANAVIFIHRQAVFDKEDYNIKNDADLIIAKNRMGQIGNSKLVFNGKISSFTNPISF